MKTYQLGLEERYAAEVCFLWIQAERPCELRFRAAKTEGLIVVDVTDPDLANKILVKTKCKVFIKDSQY